MLLIFLSILAVVASVLAQCPDYSDYSTQTHPPFSGGKYNLAYQRPSLDCRTFVSDVVEQAIIRTNQSIVDPDLSRLFINSFPNTLDTAIKWKGYAANNSEEELTFVITGDINAMWLRDSANQMQSYLPLLNASSSNNSLASLYRGVINLQSRYLLTSPYCNSFQPPAESNVPPASNSAAATDQVTPPYSNTSVFECKYELDSLAAFLEVSTDYYTATQDISFFSKFQWIDAVQSVLNVATSMMTPTYGSDGSVLTSPYSFQRTTSRASETLLNDGVGSPTGANTSLIRSAFRPSDDSTLFQLFIPANMMFSAYLNTTAGIMSQLSDPRAADLATQMSSMSSSLRSAITSVGTTTLKDGSTTVFAYETDGFATYHLMDDANIPSLLSAPLSGFLSRTEPLYQSTRSFVLSPTQNPYFMHGPVISAVGGPHNGPGYAWPMASIVRILTSDDDEEITEQLRGIVSSTDGLGLIHESINTFNQSDWTRQWFSWANGLFGQMILDLQGRKPEVLQTSFQ